MGWIRADVTITASRDKSIAEPAYRQQNRALTRFCHQADAGIHVAWWAKNAHSKIYHWAQCKPALSD